MSGSLAPAHIADALQLGAATVHEAANKTGAFPSNIRPVDPSWRIAGPALPVQCRTGDNLALHRAIVAAKPGDILVIATGDIEATWGYWGEVMSTAARVAELGGLVLQGGSRDHGVLPNVGFPVFSLGPCIQGTAKQPSVAGEGINAVIEIGGVTIQPGDLIVGDIDGVVAIPAVDAVATIEAGFKRQVDEVTMLERLRSGETTLDIFNLN